MSDHPSALSPLAQTGPLGPARERRALRPRLVLELRQQMPAWQQAVILVGAALAGAAISAVILMAAGVPAGELASEFIQTVVDADSLHAVLTQAAPLILIGVAASVAFRARFWNLGLEGQMVFGGIAATAMSLHAVGPDSGRLVLMAAAAVVAGSLWVLFPLVLRFRLHVNEIIATLLLNYVATYFLDDLLFGSWKDPVDSFPHSAAYRAFERLPDLGWSVNAALPIAFVMVGLVFWLMQRSRFGFYLRFIFANAGMAHRVGIPVTLVTATAVLLSGALAGLSGFVVVSGMEGRLTQGFFEGYGFSGVLIAFMARNNPLGAAVVALLVAMLFVTGQTLQVFYQIPFAMVQLVQAIIVICVASSEFLIRHRVNLRW